MNRLIQSTALNQLVNLKSQGATFGALSDAELKAIQNSITTLSPTLSSEEWDRALGELIDKLKSGLPESVKSSQTTKPSG